MKPKREFIPKGVNYILDEVVSVDPDKRKVETKKEAMIMVNRHSCCSFVEFI